MLKLVKCFKFKSLVVTELEEQNTKMMNLETVTTSSESFTGAKKEERQSYKLWKYIYRAFKIVWDYSHRNKLSARYPFKKYFPSVIFVLLSEIDWILPLGACRCGRHLGPMAMAWPDVSMALSFKEQTVIGVIKPLRGIRASLLIITDILVVKISAYYDFILTIQSWKTHCQGKRSGNHLHVYR